MLATRLFAYEGALRFTAQTEERESREEVPERPNTPSSTPSEASTSRAGSDGKNHFRDIQHNPELAQYFEQGVG